MLTCALALDAATTHAATTAVETFAQRCMILPRGVIQQ
jgi:hypothetical protein